MCISLTGKKKFCNSRIKIIFKILSDALFFSWITILIGDQMLRSDPNAIFVITDTDNINNPV